MKGKVIRTICVILILLFSLCQIIPVNVSAVGKCNVELRWDEGQEVQYADVEPGESGIVVFWGVVSADLTVGGAIQDVRIELRVSSNEGWTATISPATVMLNPGTEEKAFSVEVEVPPETLTSENSIITVSGTAWAFPGSDNSQTEVPPITGAIIIEQYCRFEICCEKPYILIEPGNEARFEIFIRNEGNAKDEFEVTINNINDLVNEDLQIELDREMVQVPVNGNGTVIMVVKTPETDMGEFVDYKQNIDIQVKSQADPASIPQTYTLTLRVKNQDILESEVFYDLIIVIIILVLIIVIIWQYRKRKKELNDYLK
jgi:uncharacterized membrane protein